MFLSKLTFLSTFVSTFLSNFKFEHCFEYFYEHFRGIIKFTIESVPIPAGSWQDVNQMLGPVELVPSKSAPNISLMILPFQMFGRYLPQERLPPQK